MFNYQPKYKKCITSEQSTEPLKLQVKKIDGKYEIDKQLKIFGISKLQRKTQSKNNKSKNYKTTN